MPKTCFLSANSPEGIKQTGIKSQIKVRVFGLGNDNRKRTRISVTPSIPLAFIINDKMTLRTDYPLKQLLRAVDIPKP
ncbi:unnamed protein product [Leptosia nina]|uniref:Uncharacterized protein n=1 Tax=Leptosia nina TaxID=320188 RepID=A0AAV1IYH7_9NEOP